MCLDIFLSSGSQDVNPLPSVEKHEMHPLLSWDIISLSHGALKDELEKKTKLEKLLDICNRHQWTLNNDFILQNKYQTLVLTDTEKKILWVSSGFKEMTGYPKNFAIGKKPVFLQGKRTDVRIKEEINTKLFSQIPFTVQIVNYKKDNTEYICEVTIIPVFNYINQICAFLALESEAN